MKNYHRDEMIMALGDGKVHKLKHTEYQSLVRHGNLPTTYFVPSCSFSKKNKSGHLLILTLYPAPAHAPTPHVGELRDVEPVQESGRMMKDHFIFTNGRRGWRSWIIHPASIPHTPYFIPNLGHRTWAETQFHYCARHWSHSMIPPHVPNPGQYTPTV